MKITSFGFALGAARKTLIILSYSYTKTVGVVGGMGPFWDFESNTDAQDNVSERGRGNFQ